MFGSRLFTECSLVCEDNRLFIMLARRALKWDEPTAPAGTDTAIRIAGAFACFKKLTGAQVAIMETSP